MPSVTKQVPLSEVPKPWRAGLPKTTESTVVTITMEIPQQKPAARAFQDIVANLKPSTPTRDTRSSTDIVREMRDERTEQLLRSTRT